MILVAFLSIKNYRFASVVMRIGEDGFSYVVR